MRLEFPGLQILLEIVLLSSQSTPAERRTMMRDLLASVLKEGEAQRWLKAANESGKGWDGSR